MYNNQLSQEDKIKRKCKYKNYSEEEIKTSDYLRLFGLISEEQKDFYIENNIHLKNPDFVYKFLKHYFKYTLDYPQIIINFIKTKQTFPSEIGAYQYFFLAKDLWYNGIIEDALPYFGLLSVDDFYINLGMVELSYEVLFKLYEVDKEHFRLPLLEFINSLPNDYNDWKVTKQYKDNGIVDFFIQNYMNDVSMEYRLNKSILRIMRHIQITKDIEKKLIDLITFDDRIEYKAFRQAIVYNKKYFENLLFINKLTQK